MTMEPYYICWRWLPRVAGEPGYFGGNSSRMRYASLCETPAGPGFETAAKQTGCHLHGDPGGHRPELLYHAGRRRTHNP